MDLDLDEINEIFFEESFEGLDVMESGLLNLEEGEAESEVINDIFRAAHSIKGGAGTFGFMEVSEFTHTVETLLDEMRSGDREVTKQDVQLLLKSVDYLRDIMNSLKDKQDVDHDAGNELQEKIKIALEGGSVSSCDLNESLMDENNSSNKVSIWNIKFEPHLSMLQSGNDPLMIVRELNTLGEVSVKPIDNSLPAFDALDPENCYLSWEISLKGEVTKEQILEAFDWVLDECDLDISESKNDATSEETIEVGDQSKDNISKEPEKKTTQQKKSKSNKPKAAPPVKESTSIRVSIEKVDALLDLVGELVITQSMLKRFGNEYEPESIKELADGLGQLERFTRELQDNVMDIRMLPISFSFSRFPRLVHDISSNLGKKVELKMSGEQTELDKTVLEKIGDPLVHLVRNSLDHGIETPDVRAASGKPETGTLHLSASQEGGNILIKVEDDGAGINTEKILDKARDKGIVGTEEQLSDEKINNLIFHPGLSTNDEVSDLSGRGVGMDVVRRNINDLGGRVDIHSVRGVGSTLTIRLPLTLAILDGQLVRIGDEVYIISLLSIVETILVKKDEFNHIAGSADVYKMREEYIPVVHLNDVFNDSNDTHQVTDKNGLLMVVESDGLQMGLFVDELLDQQQVVIKNLDENYRQIDGLSGATILGDGTVALILDVPGLVQKYFSSEDEKSVLQKNAA